MTVDQQQFSMHRLDAYCLLTSERPQGVSTPTLFRPITKHSTLDTNNY